MDTYDDIARCSADRIKSTHKKSLRRGRKAVCFCLVLSLWLGLTAAGVAEPQPTAAGDKAQEAVGAGNDSALTAAASERGQQTPQTARRTVRVAFPIQDGMSFFREDGKADGYNCGYLEKVEEYTGWEIEYVPYDSGDQNMDIEHALEDLEAGKVDLLGPLLKSSESSYNLIYPEQNYGTVYTTLCALESGDLREESIATLDVLRVGLWKQAKTRNEEVLGYLDTENYHYQVFYYDSQEEQLEALQREEVDVISNVSLNPIEGTRIVERFAPRSYYFGAAQGKEELLQELDEAIRTINKVQPGFQDELFDRYFRNTKDVFALTEKQQEYLGTLGKIQVLCVDYDAPYVFLSDGKPAGMLISVLENFAQETGLDLEYTFCESRAEAEERMKEGHYDLFIGRTFPADYCAEIGFVKSNSVMESSLAYLHKSKNSRHEIVAVESGMETELDVSDFDKVVLCENIVACVAAVRSGTADYAIGERSGLEYYMYDMYDDFSTSLITGEEQEISIAVARGSDADFIRILNDFISSLTDVQKTAYLEAGNVHKSGFSIQSYVRANPIQASVLIAGLTALFAVSLFMVFHAHKMRRKNEELQSANQAKSEFLTRMSHDIRTPMNGIIGLLNISDTYAHDPEKVLAYHKKIRAASEYLLALINDVLDMTKLDSEEIRLSEESVDLREIFKSCKDILETRAAENGIELILNGVDSFHPPRVFTSELHLRQVVMNLVGNAIKYNKPNGKVYATAEVLSQTKDTVSCRFTIEDTGIGMSESFQRKMFEPFSQEHGEDRSELKGTGLGLSIVKKIIDKMNGTIWVESQKDVGTKFIWMLTFRIDHAYRAPESQEAAGTLDLSGKKILAAEDNALNAEILTFMLEELGAQVVLTENGKLAVEAFEASEPGEFSCILMDAMMPVMDGYTASREIRKLHREDAQRIPIIALTANAFAEDVFKSEEAGMNAHLTKPIDAEKLKACLAKLAR